MRIALALTGLMLVTAGSAQARDTLASAHESNGPAFGGADRITAADARLRREHDRPGTAAPDLVAESRPEPATASGEGHGRVLR